MEALAAIHAPSSLICKSAFSNKSSAKRTIKAGAVQGNKLHSMPPDKVEIFKSLDSWAGDNILPLLIPVEKSWQPQDLLPCASSESFFSDIWELRARARELSDEYFVCLVGDMITEEALPTYQTMLNTFDGVKDETAASNTSWATWTRAWSSEENRHGDVLSNYLYLSGRVDMKQIQKTIHYLISSGMDAGLENNPYLGFVYTSFQERATAISHGNTARMAKEKGDTVLAKLCGKVAADEKRHEKAYQRIVRKLLEMDPNETLCAISTMLRKKITMPAHFMFDGKDSDLFNHYSAVAQRIGVYTAWDYAEIVEHLIETWGLEKLEDGLDFKGRDARDFVCNHPRIVRRLAERAQVRHCRMKGGDLMLPFSWIFDREASIS